jgi:transcriptional regulator with XRE-family HTH domain
MSCCTMTVMNDEITRIAQMLKAATRFTGVSHRQIEREMKMSTGYLSRILSGKVELRMQHVLGVCHAIGLPPAAFFQAAYPSRDFDPKTGRLVAALQELMPEPEEGEAPGRPKGRKTQPSPPSAHEMEGHTTMPTSQLRRLLEAVINEMQEYEEKAQRASRRRK